MQKLDQENRALRLENAELRSKLIKTQKESEAFSVNLKMVQNCREKLEAELSETIAEIEFLKAQVERNEKERLETPILEQQQVPETSSPKKKGITGEKEHQEFSGRSGNMEYNSTWTSSICIQEASQKSFTLKNTHYTDRQSLDDFIIWRIVDGVNTMAPTPLPNEIILQPGQEYTFHAKHKDARNIPGTSCVMHRHETFGTGKVNYTILMDNNGEEIAKHECWILY
uniref:LTD domain-containing protein n=1 Tax=Caenorhabditis japonica TaxID=281687 RepID=A0A8R1EBL7_CAEJA